MWKCSGSTIPYYFFWQDPNKAIALQLNHMELCLCMLERVCEREGVVDCFITSWAELRSVVKVTCVRLKTTQEQWGLDWGASHLTLSNMLKQTLMVVLGITPWQGAWENGKGARVCLHWLWCHHSHIWRHSAEKHLAKLCVCLSLSDIWHFVCSRLLIVVCLSADILGDETLQRWLSLAGYCISEYTVMSPFLA